LNQNISKKLTNIYKKLLSVDTVCVCSTKLTKDRIERGVYRTDDEYLVDAVVALHRSKLMAMRIDRQAVLRFRAAASGAKAEYHKLSGTPVVVWQR
jgi:hypothetical protein